MDDTAIKKSTTTPQVDIAAMVETVIERLMPRVTDVIKQELAEIETRNEAKFISRQEFEELRNRFNTFPPKPAPADEVENLRQELVKVTAAKHTLETQVTDLIGSQRQLRESVVAMRENESKTNEERTRLQQSLNITMGLLDGNRSVIQGIHAEQEVARQERAEWRKKTEDLASEIRRVENITEDTEKRYIETYTPLHSFVIGDKTQPGILKMFEEVKIGLRDFREEYKKNREADQEALNFSLTMKRFIIGAIKSVMKPYVLLKILGAIGAGGAVVAFLNQLINGAN